MKVLRFLKKSLKTQWNAIFLVALFLPMLLTVPSWATPAQVLIIRHGEKPADGPDLSPRGWQRAEALVAYFEKNPAVTKYGTPAAIYATKPGKSEDSSNRPVETVTPLAKALGLTIHSAYKKDDFIPMVREIMDTPAYDGKMVLIAWKHEAIADIAAEFGVRPAPDAWDKEIFDRVWEIDFSGDRVSDFKQFSQKVLPGDGE